MLSHAIQCSDFWCCKAETAKAQAWVTSRLSRHFRPITFLQVWLQAAGGVVAASCGSMSFVHYGMSGWSLRRCIIDCCAVFGVTAWRCHWCVCVCTNLGLCSYICLDCVLFVLLCGAYWMHVGIAPIAVA